jgi:hypothetical protein
MPFNARIHQCAWRRSVVVAACGAWAQQRERMRRIVAQGLQELGWNIGCTCGLTTAGARPISICLAVARRSWSRSRPVTILATAGAVVGIR